MKEKDWVVMGLHWLRLQLALFDAHGDTPTATHTRATTATQPTLFVDAHGDRRAHVWVCTRAERADQQQVHEARGDAAGEKHLCARGKRTRAHVHICKHAHLHTRTRSSLQQTRTRVPRALAGHSTA